MSRNVIGAFVKESLYPGTQDVVPNDHVSSRTVRRAWDSNPQALSDNGFQVMSTPSWLFLREPDRTYLSGHSGGLLPD